MLLCDDFMSRKIIAHICTSGYSKYNIPCLDKCSEYFSKMFEQCQKVQLHNEEFRADGCKNAVKCPTCYET